MSQTEENYLKTIFQVQEKNEGRPVFTNEIAELVNTKAASVTDMLKRLADKKYLHYKKYQGVLLTQRGRIKALALVRKHRLWEYFLVEKLKFQWDEVHAVAEQLEHVDSELLINKLDAFLGQPRFDPHGDPIPDPEGQIAANNFRNLAMLDVNDRGKVAAVLEQQPTFLQYLDKLHIHMGTPIKVADKFDFDKSMSIVINNTSVTNISYDIAKNILVGK